MHLPNLGSEGARVVVNYRLGALQAQALVDQLTTSFATDASAIQADVGREADVVRMFEEANAKLGPVDVLVNNAAVCPTARSRK